MGRCKQCDKWPLIMQLIDITAQILKAFNSIGLNHYGVPIKSFMRCPCEPQPSAFVVPFPLPFIGDHGC